MRSSNGYLMQLTAVPAYYDFARGMLRRPRLCAIMAQAPACCLPVRPHEAVPLVMINTVQARLLSYNCCQGDHAAQWSWCNMLPPMSERDQRVHPPTGNYSK